MKNYFDQFDSADDSQPNYFDRYDDAGEVGGLINTARRAGNTALATLSVTQAIGAGGKRDDYQAQADDLDNKAASIDKLQPTWTPENRARWAADAKKTAAALRDRAQSMEQSVEGSLKRAASRSQASEAIPISKDYQDYQNAKGSEAVKQFFKNPVEIPLNIATEGAVGSAPALALSTLGSVGGAPGIALGAGMGSFSSEYASTWMQVLNDHGIDPTDGAALIKAFRDPAIAAEAKKRGVARGIPVAAFDALSGGIAGRLAKPAVKEGVKELAKNVGKEVLEQAGLGMAGETAGQVNEQLATKGKVDDLNVKDIVAEGIGEVVPGLGQIGLGAAKRGGAFLDTGRNAPESTATLHAQQKALVEGRQSVQMFPAGTEEMPLPKGFARVETDRGIFHYNPAQISGEAIEQASAAGRENEVLNLGPNSKEDIQQRAQRGEPVTAIVEQDPKGTEVKGALATPSTAAETAKVLSDHAAPGNQIITKNPAEVVKARGTLVDSLLENDANEAKTRAAAAEKEIQERASRLREAEAKRARFGDVLKTAGDVVRDPERTYAQVKGALESAKFYAEDNSLGLPQEQKEQAARAAAVLDRIHSEMQGAEQARQNAESAARLQLEAQRMAEQRAKITADKNAVAQAKAQGIGPNGTIDHRTLTDDRLSQLAEAGDKLAQREMTRREFEGSGDQRESLIDVLKTIKLPSTDQQLGTELNLLKQEMTPAQRIQLVDAKGVSLDRLAEGLRDRGFTQIQTPDDVLEYSKRALRGEDIRAEKAGEDLVDYATQTPRVPSGLTPHEVEREHAALVSAFPRLAKEFALKIGSVKAELGAVGFHGPVSDDVAAAIHQAKKLVVISARAYRDRGKGAGLLVHEIGHSYWNTLPEETRQHLRELHKAETESQSGPLYDQGRLRSNLQYVEDLNETGHKEWFAERVARLNEDWAKGRMDRTETPLLRRVAQQIREWVHMVWSSIAQGQGDDPDGNLFVHSFRRFIGAGADSSVGREAGAAYASARKAEFARSAPEFAREKPAKRSGAPAEMFSRDEMQGAADPITYPKPSDELREKLKDTLLFPFLGNKSALSNEIAELIRAGAKGTKLIGDMMAGAGYYSNVLDKLGFRDVPKIHNEWEGLRASTFAAIKADPNAVIAQDRAWEKRFSAIASRISKENPTATQNDRLKLTHRAIDAEARLFLKGQLPENAAELSKTHPVPLPQSPEVAGMYLALQNLVGKGKAITLAFDPAGEIKPLITEVNNGRAKYRSGDAYAKLMRDYSVAYTNTEVSQGDGYAKLSQNAKPDSFFFIDPGYTGESTNYSSALEYQTSRGSFQNLIQTKLLDAWKKGAKLLITNNWDGETYLLLKDLGFTVVKENRGSGDAELVAFNYDPKTGQLSQPNERANQAADSVGIREGKPSSQRPGSLGNVGEKPGQLAERTAQQSDQSGTRSGGFHTPELGLRDIRGEIAAAERELEGLREGASQEEPEAIEQRGRELTERISNLKRELQNAEREEQVAASIKPASAVAGAAKDTSSSDAASIVAAAPKVESLPKVDRETSLVEQWKRGKAMRDEGWKLDNHDSIMEGQRIVRLAKERLDEEFPGWEDTHNPSTLRESAEPSQATSPEASLPGDSEPSPFAGTADEPLPVRSGKVQEVYGNSATDTPVLASKWAAVRETLAGLRGSVPELPAFPGAAWNKADHFIRTQGTRFYDKLKQGFRLMSSINDYVQKTAEEDVAGIARPLLEASGSRIDANEYARLRKLQEKVRIAKADQKQVDPRTTATISALSSKLEASPYVLFQRLVLMLDLNWRSENLKDSAGNPIKLPSDLNRAEIKSELQRLGQLIEANPHAELIKTALQRHMELVKSVAADLKTRDLMAAEQLGNPYYFPHITLESTRGGETQQRELRPSRVKPGTEADFRGYLIDPVGSSKAIETDYVRAMYYHLVQVTAHNEKADIVRDYFRTYDVMKDVRERAAKLTRQRGQPISWEQVFHSEYAPDGYVLYGTDSRDAFPSVSVDRERLARRIGVALTSDDLHMQLEQLGLKGIRLLPEDLRETMEQGAKENWIVPARVAEALRGIADRDTAQKAAWDRAIQAALGTWKAWKLFMPWNHVRYEYGNITADLEKVFSSDPQVFKQLPSAAKELRDFWRGGTASDDLRAALKEGVLNAVTAQEMKSLANLPNFDALQTDWQRRWNEVKSRGSSVLLQPILAPLGLGKLSSVEASALREAITRYSKFKADMARLRAGARPVYSGAYHAEIDAITDSRPGAGDANFRKAAAISKATFGDYADISVFGQTLRQRFVPFYSWLEVNFKYHANTFRNLRDMVRAGETSKTEAATAGARAAAVLAAGFTRRAAGSFVLRLALPYIAVALWNNSDERKELEDKLSEEDKRRFHIILGKDADGKVHVIYAPLALMDVMKWFSGPEIVRQATMMARGQTDLPTAFTAWKDHLVPDLVNNTIGQAGPLTQIPTALVLKKRLFPDVTDPRSIPEYDMRRTVLGMMTDDFTADMLERVVSKDYYAPKDFGDWAKQLILQVRERDPEAWAYFELRDKAADFFEKKTGQKRDNSYNAPDQQVLRNFRKAVYQGDVEAAAHFYQRAMDYGYTAERFASSVRAQDPLGAIAKKDGLRKEFVQSLSDFDREQLKRAYRYYERMDVVRGKERQLFPMERTGDRGVQRFQQAPRFDKLQGLLDASMRMQGAEGDTRADRAERRSLAPPRR